MEWTNMIDALYNSGSKTELTVYWPNGLIIKGFSDGISETDNCLDEDDPDYKEYYMCVIKITDIVRLPNQGTFNEKVGDLLEVSVLNEPIKIEEKGKSVIWKKQLIKRG